jgi:hypothetical protein
VAGVPVELSGATAALVLDGGRLELTAFSAEVAGASVSG